jgi:hypothetical protein
MSCKKLAHLFVLVQYLQTEGGAYQSRIFSKYHLTTFNNIILKEGVLNEFQFSIQSI